MGRGSDQNLLASLKREKKILWRSTLCTEKYRSTRSKLLGASWAHKGGGEGYCRQLCVLSPLKNKRGAVGQHPAGGGHCPAHAGGTPLPAPGTAQPCCSLMATGASTICLKQSWNSAPALMGRGVCPRWAEKVWHSSLLVLHRKW